MKRTIGLTAEQEAQAQQLPMRINKAISSDVLRTTRVSWSGWSAVLLRLAPMVAALAGLGWGRYMQDPSDISPGQLAFLAGGLLGFVSLYQKSTPGRQARNGRLAAACLIVYVLLAWRIEPLTFLNDEPGVLCGIAWLSPLIVGGVLLPGRKCWLVGLGCCLVLFSGTVALGYNVGRVHSGMGFLIRWLA